MIYVLAFFLPPLALLFNGQIFAAIFNAILFVLFLVLGLLFLSPWLRSRRHTRSSRSICGVKIAGIVRSLMRSKSTARLPAGGINGVLDRTRIIRVRSRLSHQRVLCGRLPAP